MVIAVGDIGSTIIWTATKCKVLLNVCILCRVGSGVCWYECLGFIFKNSTIKLSNEHYMESIHDWVCYAAPIHTQNKL